MKSAATATAEDVEAMSEDPSLPPTLRDLVPTLNSIVDRATTMALEGHSANEMARDPELQSYSDAYSESYYDGGAGSSGGPGDAAADGGADGGGDGGSARLSVHEQSVHEILNDLGFDLDGAGDGWAVQRILHDLGLDDAGEGGGEGGKGADEGRGNDGSGGDPDGG